MADHRVLIVGAGAAGLTAATALHRRSGDVGVVEKRSAIPRVRSGPFLPGVGVTTDDGRIGVHDLVLAADGTHSTIRGKL